MEDFNIFFPYLEKKHAKIIIRGMGAERKVDRAERQQKASQQLMWSPKKGDKLISARTRIQD